jgi:hypothetical protein
MSIWMKNKLVTIIVAAVAVFTVAGAGVVMAAQSHNSSPRTSNGAAQAGDNFEAQGVIQQVMFDQGTTQSGSLIFLPNGNRSTVTVTFTSATEIHTNTTSSSSQNADANQQGALQASMTIKVEGTVQADGSVLAREINANTGDANDNDNNDDNNGQEDEHLTGVIQSVDQGSQTFALLPDGQSASVTIAYDANTHVEDEHDDDNSGVALVAGAHVRVEVVKQADGSLYAREIGPVNDNQGNGDDHGGTSGPGGGDDNGGDHHGGSDN